MSVNFKVIGGTPHHDTKSLCETCRFAQVLKGFRDSEMAVRCGAEEPYIVEHGGNYQMKFYPGHLVVPFRVAECASYRDKRQMPIEDMFKIALKIDPERVRVSGFAPKKDPQ